MNSPTLPEHWLRGPVPGVPQPLQPAAHALLQAHDELHAAANDLDVAALWAKPSGVASVGFHVKHAAGVADRLLTYARGESLSEAQRAYLAHERDPGTPPADADDVLGLLDGAVARTLAAYRATDPATLEEPRHVGRQQLPATVGGLLFHAAEHLQRHAGQAGTTSRIVRGLVAAADAETMARDLATVRGVYDAYARRDMDAVAAVHAPEVELVQSTLLPWGGTYHGLEGVHAFLAALVAHVDSVFEPQQLVPAGDRIVAIGRTRGTVRSTGAAFDVPGVHIWTMRDGRVARYEAYVDTPAMLAAMGR